ncbi:hypothetical protein [Paraflavitalea sp. CAU 1676]|uniref:hypothetical protein n=1 Tax=Paraflavitalea sp. CAU 1676 TaxID=3032598 RepID=UPI0023DA3D9E|nr:hypothetical protein [Paraflavitalea sp. CAU 1676]MDF2192571.1 hypothetical protein [Paraflavitalea sp. CAU 1676]
MNIWIIVLTVILTVVPLIKIAKEKSFGVYNSFVILIGATVMIISVVKLRKDEVTEKNNEKATTDNVTKINKLVNETQLVRNNLFNVRKSLDSFGLTLNEANGAIVIKDREKLKNIILSGNNATNVTSINQKGGQTARDIINN